MRCFILDYELFITEIQKYWDLYNKGLKKQANRFLFDFTDHFKASVSKENADTILFQFCKEYLDDGKFPNANLPFQITKLLDNYLMQECEKNNMPQMRWTFQLFGKYPHDILERAYAHKECDQKTVELYFNEQIDCLWLGQHHFPEGCLITHKEFEDTVNIANKILTENAVNPSLIAEFQYYVKLYHIYFKWEKNGKIDDFYELCRKENLKYEKIAAFYYKK